MPYRAQQTMKEKVNISFFHIKFFQVNIHYGEQLVRRQAQHNPAAFRSPNVSCSLLIWTVLKPFCLSASLSLFQNSMITSGCKCEQLTCQLPHGCKNICKFTANLLLDNLAEDFQDQIS
jgi:hypothetical protein